MKLSLIAVLTLVFISCYGQENIQSKLNKTLSFRGLSEKDITIPISTDKDKSPTNNSKLLLPKVKELMESPLKSFEFMEEIKNIDSLSILQIINKLGSKVYQDRMWRDMVYVGAISKYNPLDQKTGYNPDDYKADIKLFFKNIKDIKKYDREFLKNNFSKSEIKFLNKNLFSIIEDTEDGTDNNNSDIFKYNALRDSSWKISKNTLDLLSKVNYGPILENEYYRRVSIFYTEYQYLLENIKDIQSLDKQHITNQYVDGDFYFYLDDEDVRIAIGDAGKNIYNGHFDLIIDIGGDDVYNMSNEILTGNNFLCIMDFAGNDFYNTYSDFGLAGAVFSTSMIFDKAGNDIYKSQRGSLGAAIGGIGLLYDEAGDDIYEGNSFSQGAACFGIGLLYDKNGNDTYIANTCSQAFGMTQGIGSIIDEKGNDSYLISPRSLDIGRYEDHYVSMCQGYGLGLRPYYAGGIGLLLDCEGNDIYNTDIFGQGGGYWYALGMLIDKKGNDKYNGYQYSQGAGIHLAVGLLQDDEGWDFYQSNGVSQGCGHDYGFGLLFDQKGNDNYSAYSLSQGAGNANGIGMFIDEEGRDGYLNKEPGNCRGYGNPRREYGSLGIFLDGSGTDFYSEPGYDSTINNSSLWGTFNDVAAQDEIPNQVSGENYKVEMNSSRSYSQDELFVMAKTIEPRFSKWQEYGFNKLVEDSTNTAEYILKYLDTDDHRVSLVLRNLAFKIGTSMAEVFKKEIRKAIGREYQADVRYKTPVLNNNQLAFICYLFGETRNSSAKEELFKLTYEENVRVKTSAINALGKIIIDTTYDAGFINKMSDRLLQLVNEDSDNKIIYKDIAHALKNYKSNDSFEAYKTLLFNDYYGPRFIASDALKNYWNENEITDKDISGFTSDRLAFQQFIYSISSLEENKFKEVFDKILNQNISYEEVIKYNLVDILNQKIKSAGNPLFIEWMKNRKEILMVGLNQKI
ncbi:MAG: hypothetical protein J0M18_12505 [Ignavibacteria bacterium]|nr:hypothetical protein [Ignavibacteria bacterium]